MTTSHRLYPLFLRVEGRPVLVVGAGVVSERKVEELLEAGASVRVVAPKATPRIRELATAKKIVWKARSFVPRDLTGAWLVVTATSAPSVQKRVAKLARTQRLFVVAVDDVKNSSAYSGSTVRRGPYVIAISSSGEAPALTRLLREILEEILPDPKWIQAAHALRAKWKAEKVPMGDRFGQLVRAFKGQTRGR